MNSNFKKGVSALIVTAMIASITPVSASAALTTETNTSNKSTVSYDLRMSTKRDIDPYEKAINDLGGGTTKTELLTLLSVLNDARKAERDALKDITDETEKQEAIDTYKDTIEAAKTALQEALTEAGIELPTISEGKTGIEDFDKIGENQYEKSINDLEDGTIKIELLNLLSILNDARKAERDALKDITDETEKQEAIDTYKDTIEAAKTALQEALTEAGIELPTRPEGKIGMQQKKSN